MKFYFKICIIIILFNTKVKHYSNIKSKLIDISMNKPVIKKMSINACATIFKIRIIKIICIYYTYFKILRMLYNISVIKKM